MNKKAWKGNDVNVTADSEIYKELKRLAFSVCDDEISIENALAKVRELTSNNPELKSSAIVELEKMIEAISASRNRIASERYSIKKFAKKEVRAEDFGLEDQPQEPLIPELRKDFDVKQHVKDEVSGVKLLLSTFLFNPHLFSRFIGMKDVDLVKTVNWNIYKIIAKYNLTPLPAGFRIKSFSDAVNVLSTFTPVVARNEKVGSDIIVDLLGMDAGSNKLVKRLYEYVPVAISGKEELQEAMKELTKPEKQNLQNKILDLFNEGKITQDEMKEKMLEFAMFREGLKKIASSIFEI